MFLVYGFIEDLYLYFKSKTNFLNQSHDSVKATNESFNNLESLMQVTLININNYVHYLLMRLNASYFEITNLSKLLVFLSEQFGSVNLIGTMLAKQVWSNVLEIVVENYIVVFFANEKQFLDFHATLSKFFSFEAGLKNRGSPAERQDSRGVLPALRPRT